MTRINPVVAPSAEPRMAYIREPTNRHQPVLGRHQGLGLPSLLGFTLRPMPSQQLRAAHGTKTGKGAQILSAAEAADRLAGTIQDAVLVPFGARYERCIAWLRLAAKLPATMAPLLHEVGVRHALLAALGGAQPVEHVHAHAA